MLAGRKYRVEFDPGQRIFAERLGGICRSVWNTGLQQRREYRKRGGRLGYAEQCAQLADAKKDPYCAWLADAPAQVIQQILKDLDQACSRHGTWKVNWKSKTRWKPSFRFPTAKHIPVERINRTWGRVFLPKFGWVKFRMSRPLGGVVKSATVSLDGEFFDRRHATTDGVSSWVIPPAAKQDRTSDLGYLTRGEAERYLRLQRRLARSAKGSKRRKAIIARLGEIMHRVRWRRSDFNAQTAHRLTRDYGVVILEDLKTTNLTSAARPKPDPGRPGAFLPNGRAAKSGLNKAILDKGWYGLEIALRSKARYTGTVIAEVPAPYTSQTCPAPACGVVDGKSRKSQALFSCTACGHTEHADIVGAKNTLAKYQAAGLVVSGRGDPSGSVKRQAPRSTARAAPAARTAA
ncbi:transposase [Nonomuraea sp. NPDC048882]|uniref:RNA-guided endonuclease InsQ/TnpB family protein n=1 Tax=unclassified Nonomuraea TaxID=2593643 RepID=UPI0033E59957